MAVDERLTELVHVGLRCTGASERAEGPSNSSSEKGSQGTPAGAPPTNLTWLGQPFAARSTGDKWIRETHEFPRVR